MSEARAEPPGEFTLITIPFISGFFSAIASSFCILSGVTVSSNFFLLQNNL